MKDTLRQAVESLQHYTVSKNRIRTLEGTPFQCNIVPMVAQWVHLSGQGTLGNRFCSELSNAHFELTCTLGQLENVYKDSDKAELVATAQNDWMRQMQELEMAFFKHVFDTNSRGRAVAMTSAKQQLCRSRKCSDIPDDDSELLDLALDLFVEHHANRIFKTDSKTGAWTFKMKKKVLDGAKEVAVPIFNTKGTLLNTDNSTPVVRRGDLVGATVRLNTYVLNNGRMGVSIRLVDVVHVGTTTNDERPSKRRKVDYSQLN